MGPALQDYLQGGTASHTSLYFYTFSATRSLALRARGLCASSSSPEPLNVRQAAGHMGPALRDYLQGDTASRVPLYLLRHA